MPKVTPPGLLEKAQELWTANVPMEAMVVRLERSEAWIYANAKRLNWPARTPVVNRGKARPGSRQALINDSMAKSREVASKRDGELFGDLTDDVRLLRERGHDVTTTADGGFAYNGRPISREDLKGKAERERRLMAPAPPAAVDRISSRTNGPGPAGRFVARMPAPPPPAEFRPLPPMPPSIADPVTAEVAQLRGSIAQLRQDIEFLHAVVADAIAGRRGTLLAQAEGLAEIEARLRAKS